MKWHKSILLVVFLLILAMPAFAAPPVTTVGNGLSSGISIASPKFEYITLNQNYTFRIHIFNSSNGMPLHTVPSCYMDLYNPTGVEILSKEFGKAASTNDYNLIINKANQSISGLYSYILWCNSTAYRIGGFVDGSYVVVRDTQLYRLLDGKPYFSFTLLAFMFAIAFFMLYFSNQFKLNGEPWGITLTKISSALVLKLLSLATVIYSLFLYKNTTPDVTNVTKVFDSYMSMFIWAMIAFFIIYFVHQFVMMAVNYDMRREQQGKKRLGE